ncbi:hypothetical protein HDE_03007 [Halotydeus destructor]|nr:hypothetical protein HDE_03007 [Halotydeus destructor]
MSLMLKSLIAITRATPAYKLSSAGQSADSYVVCYRVYQSDVSFSSVLGSKEATHYSPEVKLGSLPCNGNLLTVSVCYRTDMVPCAKSGLLHNEIPKLMPVTTDHFQEMSPKDDHLNYDSIKPLVAAFASSPSNATDTLPFLPETAFSSLFITREVAPKQQNSDELLSVKSSVSRTQSETKPVTIPEKNGKQKELTTSPAGSSGDSFVFVDLKAPFASHDQHELGSFFNGPSPAFTSSAECSEDFGDISSHLADIESNVEQWDSFVDSVCCPLDEESKILT